MTLKYLPQPVTNVEPIVKGTGWDVYSIKGREVYVKREDLSVPDPGPKFSKIRGLNLHLDKILQERGPVHIGILDTRHSKAGWGTAYLCNLKGMPCVNYYPLLKAELGKAIVRPNQLHAAALGANLVPLASTYPGYILKQFANKLFYEAYPLGEMLPVGLKLDESVEATYIELLTYTPEELLHGDWVISISTGTIAAGVLKALDELKFTNSFVLHMGYSRSIDHAANYILTKAGLKNVGFDLDFVDEGFDYADKVDNKSIPFPCNEYYDAKAWNWLEANLGELRDPVVFWNIGE